MIYIFVDSGVVQEVIGAEEYWVIDFDLLDAALECPGCGYLIDDAFVVVCPECGVDWGASPTHDEIIQKLEAYRKAKSALE